MLQNIVFSLWNWMKNIFCKTLNTFFNCGIRVLENKKEIISEHNFLTLNLDLNKNICLKIMLWKYKQYISSANIAYP